MARDDLYYTSTAHEASAKEAVKENYLEWVATWGEKFAAKEIRFVAMQTGQEEEPVFANQMATTSSKTIVVDQSGRGDVSTVKEAVNRVPEDNEDRIIIHINPGTYQLVL